jgi:hypothetical protein
MTPEEINLALAKFMGWRWNTWGKKEVRVFAPKGEPARWSGQDEDNSITFPIQGKSPEEAAEWVIENAAPDYAKSLDALARVEAKLTEEQMAIYEAWLYQVCKVDPNTIFARETFKIIHATAAQKSEALCRALKLWKD